MKQAEAAAPNSTLAGTFFLLFLVTGKQFAVDLNRVEQIIEYQPTTRPTLLQLNTAGRAAVK